MTVSLACSLNVRCSHSTVYKIFELFCVCIDDGWAIMEIVQTFSLAEGLKTKYLGIIKQRGKFDEKFC